VQQLRSSTSEPQRLTVPWLIALHLCPGIVFTALLIVTSRLFVQHGLTAYLAELLLVPVCLAPMLAGVVLFWNARTGEGLSLVRSITYRERGSAADYILWPILLYLTFAAASLVVGPLSSVLQQRFLGWFPSQLTVNAMISGLASSPPGSRLATLLLGGSLSGVVAPLVEESYFRGFLLPRIRHLGIMAPILNAFLFGLHHFFSPWSLPVIFVAFLPVAYVVQAKRNYRIGVVVHAMFNLTGVLTLAARVM
jgi:membrane protease YdiL (CAAX protease family)